MNPRAFSLFQMRKYRADHRSPLRREDEEPLHFLVSNLTYRLVLSGERCLKRWQAMRDRQKLAALRDQD